MMFAIAFMMARADVQQLLKGIIEISSEQLFADR
jgi:hypothetical protein